jgi:hypothetical protein
MNAGTLETARLRHPAGSRLAERSAAAGAAPLRLLPPVVPQQLVGEVGAGVRRRPVTRLTRRGRVVVLGLTLVLMFGAGLAFGSHADGADSRSAVAPVRRTMVVQPGQTLWGIARSIEPAADPRWTVERLIEINALPGAEIEAGRTLVLP